MERFAKGLVAGLATASDTFAGAGLYEACEECDLEKIEVCLTNPEAVNYLALQHERRSSHSASSVEEEVLRLVVIRLLYYGQLS